MIENNYYTENADLVEQFTKIVDWKEIVDVYEMGFKDARAYKENGDENLAYAPNDLQEAMDYYAATLESVGEVAGKTIAPLAQQMDLEGLKYANGKVTFPESMKKGYNAFKDAGLLPYALSRHYGGLGLPAMAQAFLIEVLSRGDASLGIALGCTNIGECLEHFGSDEIRNEYVTKLASGEYSCAMALTEPNYGSDLQNLQTRAEQDADGVWRLSGAKRFITHGCGFDETPSLILTLARTGAKTSGGRGLSFFVVESGDVEIAGIEKKMGLHCSATCEVVYENSKGVLIGEVGEGLIKGAMGMMNSARLAIAAQSLGIAVASQEEAKKYASERIQFGKPIEELPPVKKMLDRMEREVAAMRCCLLEAARGVDMYAWRKSALHSEGMKDKEIRKDPQVKTWEKLASFFTPLSKYYISEWCNIVAYDAVQIHGGSGFCEDYDVARLYRDARITTIYEGTTQLQTLAAIGGFTAGFGANGYLRAYLDEEISKFETSSAWRNNRKEFEDLASSFKTISDKETISQLNFEVMEAGGRVMIGMLMERAASRLDGEAQEKRLKLCRDYNLDSASIIAANKVKVLAAAQEPAKV